MAYILASSQACTKSTNCRSEICFAALPFLLTKACPSHAALFFSTRNVNAGHLPKQPDETYSIVTPSRLSGSSGGFVPVGSTANEERAVMQASRRACQSGLD